jgi:hypothetical protein
MFDDDTLSGNIAYSFVVVFLGLLWFAFTVSPLVLGICLGCFNPYLRWIALGFLITLPIGAGIAMYALD